MMFKVKVFYDTDSRESATGPTESSESSEVKANGELLDELKHYVLDNTKLTEDTKLLVRESVLNTEETDFDMDNIRNYLSKNGEKVNSKATIVAWQVLLKKNGLYTGKIDGIRGPLTNKAITDFKKQNGLEGNDDVKAFNDKLLGSTSSEVLSQGAETRLKGVEQKYEGLSSQLDFTSGTYFKEGFIGEDGSFSYAGETYKKVDDGDSSYEGLGYQIGTQKVGETEYKYVKVGTYKNGKLNGSGVQIYSDGEKHVVDFKDGVKSGYAHKVYSEKDSNGWKEYFGQIENDMNNGKGKLVFKDGSVYEGEFKDNKIEGKGKLTTAAGETKEGNFVNGEIQEGYTSNIQSETVTDNDGSAIYTEKTPDGKLLYEGMRHTDGKIDASWLQNHKTALADENSFKGVLWGKTYKSDGGYQMVRVGPSWKEANIQSEMDKSGKGVQVVKADMEKGGKKGKVTVETWGNSITVEVDNGWYKFITPDPEGGGRFVLGGEKGLNFSSQEEALRAASLINFAVHGVDKRKASHSGESFDNFQKDGSGIDLDMHGNGVDIQWIRSNAENYFGGAKINDITSWMNRYYRSHEKGTI